MEGDAAVKTNLSNGFHMVRLIAILCCTALSDDLAVK